MSNPPDLPGDRLAPGTLASVRTAAFLVRTTSRAVDDLLRSGAIRGERIRGTVYVDVAALEAALGGPNR